MLLVLFSQHPQQRRDLPYNLHGSRPSHRQAVRRQSHDGFMDSAPSRWLLLRHAADDPIHLIEAKTRPLGRHPLDFSIAPAAPGLVREATAQICQSVANGTVSSPTALPQLPLERPTGKRASRRFSAQLCCSRCRMRLLNFRIVAAILPCPA